MAKKVLVVDDEKLIVKGIRFSLEQDGMEVDCAYDGEEALKMATENAYDMVLLDIMLPKMDGFEVCQHIREFSNMPIVMLTAKGDDMDKILGLEYGADDYITKPFGIMEFLSRVRAALRRSAPEEKQNVYAFHEILLDNARHSVTVNGTHIDLTYKEYSLLRLLLENTNLVVTRETILQVVWGTDISVESRTVDMHIRTLRKKLGDAGKYICTVRKVGYKLADSEEGEEE